MVSAALNRSCRTRDTASTRLAASLKLATARLPSFDSKLAMLQLQSEVGFKLPVKGAVLQLCRRAGKIAFKKDAAPVKDEIKLGIISKPFIVQQNLGC